MSWSRKYGRTYHYPFSPGTSSDDRINWDWWEHLSNIDTIIHTEKLDGENTCLNQYGVFARSHAAPTMHPWANYLKERWAWMRHDLGELEIFGENLYAIHSLRYTDLEEHFYIFGIRYKEVWLCWEEVEFYADYFGLPTVPVLDTWKLADYDIGTYEAEAVALAQGASTFDAVDVHTEETSPMEGIVSRNIAEYQVDDFPENVFKYVRKDHVKTDEHWRRKWKRAPLNWEYSS